MEGEKPAVGTLFHFDLTVENADQIRDFYASVIGWQSVELEMDGYADYVMTDGESGKWVAGVCHARGVNANLPPQWLIYIVVEDLEASLARCTELGGKALTGILGGEGQRYCVIQDPAGAVMALGQVG
jgi:uncharacterized protein